MADPISSLLPAGVPAAKASAKAHKTVLDQADFLALMSAQLKNQDPTKPVDNSEYVAQMAQFSTVNGIAAMNGAIAQSNTTLTGITNRLDTLITATNRQAKD
jgi:flagellar basal-body rod modification protein FlgD